jgi:phosphonoacetaldehyde dehydrogenase
MLELASLVAGRPVANAATLAVRSPYDGATVGTVRLATRADTEAAVAAALAFRDTPTRYRRAEILDQTRLALEARREEFARTIAGEAGLALREARYEVGRTVDVLRFAALEALRDDGQIFSCDISAQGKARKIFTTREPLRCAAAITPFNHPLNQVAHKLAPALAAGTPIVLKPSEKTPLVALKFAELLYAAGLPAPMLSVLLGPTADVAEPLVRHPEVELVAFTGSVAVGKRIAATAGYKKLVLELGGNDPLIVLDDADLDLAVTLAAEGSYRNSGQRCTAVKRVLVQDGIAPEFTRRLVAKTREYVCGDPFDEATKVGTVIDEASAAYLETVVKEAVAAGAEVLAGAARLPDGGLRKLRPARAHPDRAGPGRRPRPRQRHRLRPELRRGDHQPEPRAEGDPHAPLRHGEHQRGARLPRREQPLRRHQGLRPRHQGRRDRGHEGLRLREDVQPAVVRPERRSPVRPAAAAAASNWPRATRRSAPRRHTWSVQVPG